MNVKISYQKHSGKCYAMLSGTWAGRRLFLGSGVNFDIKEFKKGTVQRNARTRAGLDHLAMLQRSFEDIYNEVYDGNIKLGLEDPTPNHDDVKKIFVSKHRNKPEIEATFEEFVVRAYEALSGWESPGEIRRALMDLIDATNKIKKEGFQGSAKESFVTYCESLIPVDKNDKNAPWAWKRPNTLNSISTVLRALKRFENHIARTITFAYVARDVFDKDFFGFLIQENRKASTVNTYFKNLYAFINQAKEDKKFGMLKVSKSYKPVKSRSTQVWLTEEEIDLLYNADLQGKTSEVRHRFLCSYYTAADKVDLDKITLTNINGNENYSFFRQKTIRRDSKSVIRIHDRLIEILKMYGGEVPKAYWDDYQNNKLIRAILKDLGVTEKVVIKEEFAGGRIVTSKVTKADKVSMKTARRSIATQLYLNKWPLTEVSKFLGHKDANMTKKYLWASDIQIFEERTKGLKF